MNSFKTIAWEDDFIKILDQTRLPSEEIYLECRDLEAVAKAIEILSVRGAPAIGVAAAMALACESQKFEGNDFKLFLTKFNKMCDRLRKTRPTAVSLGWALKRMFQKVLESKNKNVSEIKQILKKEADIILNEDIAINRSMGMFGQEMLPDSGTVMTICNAGSLATAGYGTALGVIRAAVEKNKDISVVSCETRPLLQGARLTCWELQKDNIPVILITDSMAGYYMRKKGVDIVITGADRVAANGDSANKIGTYSLSILAKEHNVPFYIAAPISTIDVSAETGDDIPIEERLKNEVTQVKGHQITPDNIGVWNPSFDVVPNKYISGIITEKGILRPPFNENIKKIVSN